jgi:hypothetical protein
MEECLLKADHGAIGWGNATKWQNVADENPITTIVYTSSCGLSGPCRLDSKSSEADY